VAILPHNINDNRPMQTHFAKLSLWWLRIATFLLAAAAAASATYWVLKMRANPGPGQPALMALATPAQVDLQAAVRLLGGNRTAASSAIPDSASSHFKLLGIIADRNKSGYALIAVDGKPPKPVAVGAHLNDSLLLQSLGPRSAALASSIDGPVALTLELPKTSRTQAPDSGTRAQARASPQRN